jgi:hypothetical protein
MPPLDNPPPPSYMGPAEAACRFDERTKVADKFDQIADAIETGNFTLAQIVTKLRNISARLREQSQIRSVDYTGT